MVRDIFPVVVLATQNLNDLVGHTFEVRFCDLTQAGSQLLEEFSIIGDDALGTGTFAVKMDIMFIRVMVPHLLCDRVGGYALKEAHKGEIEVAKISIIMGV